jgi:dihydrofolate synthase/folylpolyglutamate synthase
MDLGLPDVRLPGLSTSLIGRHQARNQALAAWGLGRLPAPLAPDAGAIRRGLATVAWPARFECAGGSPRMVWDAGHNPQGIEATVVTFEEVFGRARPVVLAGFSTDKELDSMLAPLARIAGRVVVSQSGHWRAADPAAVVAAWGRAGHGAPAEAVADPAAALVRAIAAARSDGMVLITGSIYLVGELIPRARELGVPAPAP